MHVFFSGIGGTGIGPLALIAKQAGYDVSGSDKQESDYVLYLKKHGINDISIGQSEVDIATINDKKPIDWLVYSSAVAIENPDAPEFQFCKKHGIKTSKRDEFLNEILAGKGLKLVAVAGTHGKTTTTAMLIWLFKQLGHPISYSVGAKLSFGDMGEYDEGSKYFVYEADEFDRNFLAFHPYMSLITGIDWDHPDIYPTREEYEIAFDQFVNQTRWTIFWQPDFAKLHLQTQEKYLVLSEDEPLLESILLPGHVNRKDAWQVIQAVHAITEAPIDQLIDYMNIFPGLSRRFELIVPGLYTDYAHTPEKIRGALQLAQEVASDKYVVVYEGLHNTRQHFIKNELAHMFDEVKHTYVVPSYLAREDPNLPTLSPQDIIALFSKPETATPLQLDDKLKETIKRHIHDGDLVLCLSAGGGGSLDEWLRRNFRPEI
jgi:UDP-N-acetylmuramate--alanine ligase